MGFAHRVQELLTVGDVAKLLGLSPQYVHELIGKGFLTPSATTPGGFRLFERKLVERFKAKREATFKEK